MHRIIIGILLAMTIFQASADQWVVRGNQHHLQAHGITVTQSDHGYGYIDSINKNKIVSLSAHEQSHWQLMEASKFHPIKPSQAQKRITDPNIELVLTQIDSDRWLNDVVTLTGWNRVTGSQDNDLAKDWIANKLTALGYDVTTPAFQVHNQTTHNIMASQIGQTRPNDWYVIGAHMDSIPYSGGSPGAVDNASGCAAVLEMARVASMYEFEGSLLFICYSGEEQGLHGSAHHVNSMTATERDEIKAILTMDMIGYKDGSSHKLLLETSPAQQHIMQLMEQMAATYVPQLTVYTSLNPFGSDHMPYINNGMPAILSIDDDWDQYDDYHRSTDLPENLNNYQALYIIRTNMAALATLATLVNSDVIFADDFEAKP